MDLNYASGSGYTYNKLQDYEPPSWAKDLKYQPSAYVQVLVLKFIVVIIIIECWLFFFYVLLILQLAVRPTPIHLWNLPGVPSGFQVSVKRDDMTGSVLSGNKVYM